MEHPLSYPVKWFGALFRRYNFRPLVLGMVLRGGGDGVIPEQAAAGIRAASQVLNIEWIAEALDSPASVICPRSGACPRQPQGCV